MAVHYEHARWLESFLASWPEKGAAPISYFSRITDGPAYELSKAVRFGVSLARGN